MIESLRSKSILLQWLLFFILLSSISFILWPFWVPLCLAGVFALGINDLIFRLAQKTRWNHKAVVILTLLAGLALFWAPLSLVTYKATAYFSQPEAIESDQILAQAHSVKEIALEGLQKLSSWSGTDLATPARGLLESLLNRVGEVLFSYSSYLLGQLPSILLASFVFIFSLIVFLLHATNIKATILKYSPLKEEICAPLISEFKRSCRVTLVSTLLVGLIQALIIGLGSLIFGEGDFWLVLALTFLLSFVPVIGAAPMGFLLALFAFLGDRTQAAVGLAIFATIASSIDNFMKPYFMGGKTPISPLASFTCVLGAVIMLGLPGLLLGPVILNLFLGATPLLIRKS